jgi:glycosyltransferase involved in cell wall biosynthesis
MALAVQGRVNRPPRRDPGGVDAPRGYLFDDLFAQRYDESILDDRPLRPWERAVPGWARLAREVERRAEEYDVVVSWSERVTLSLLALQSLAPRPQRRPHVAMLYWFSRPAVQVPMRLFAESVHAIVTWSSVQRQYAIDHLGIPPEKLYLIRHFVDQLFWSPREREVDMILSAGAEMRDYPTLLDALRGTELQCHVAADHVRVDRAGFARRTPIEKFAPLAGPNVTIGRRPATELRELYARSRFVVVPLHASDTDNGVTVILEAMAMGKPVICSRTRGQVDVIEHGVTGLLVPVGDSYAMREAMLELWNNPERAREMGQAGRAFVEKHHSLEKFCRDVKGAVDASLDGHAASRDGSFVAPPLELS